MSCGQATQLLRLHDQFDVALIMYQSHVPTIAAAMRADADTFARGVMFALLSARTQFTRVPAQMRELGKRGKDAACLWGWKADAYAYIEANKATLYRDTIDCVEAGAAIAVLCRVPGMGIVKAGFVCQMLGYDVACLDVRNIIRDGREPRAFRSDGEARKSLPSFARKIFRYLAEVEGKAEHYWDAWCRDVADTYGMTPQEISALHVSSIVPRSFRGSMPVPIGMAVIPF